MFADYADRRDEGPPRLLCIPGGEMRKRRILEKVSIFLIGFFLFVICPPEAEGKTKGTFLTLGTGARALGMGSAFCGVADDANAIYWNPAGLALLYRQEITGLHINLWEETLYDSLYYAHPLGKIGTFGLGLIRLSVGGIEKRQSPLDEVSTFSNTEVALFASYSRNIWKEISGGISLKGIEHKLDIYEATGFGMDVGFLCHLPKNFSIGINFQNLLSPYIKLKSKGDNYPLNSKIGIAYSIFNLLPRHKNKLTFAVDLDKTDGVETEQHYGLEYWFKDMFALRGGYDNINDFTGGLGVKYRDFQCDYAFAQHEELETSHRFSFTAGFGHTPEERERLKQQKKVSKLFSKGKEEFKEGDIYEAGKIFKDVLLREKEYHKERKEYLERVIDALYAAGLILYEEGNYGEALKKIKEVLDLEPTHQGACKYLPLAKEKWEEQKKEKEKEKKELKKEKAREKKRKKEAERYDIDKEMKEFEPPK